MSNETDKVTNPEQTEIVNSINKVRVIDCTVLSPEQTKSAYDLYWAYRESDDEACHIGLYGDDLESTLNDPETTLFEYKDQSGESVYMPLLIPIEKLEWYNSNILHKAYGKNAKLYYYAHPPLPSNAEEISIISYAIKKEIDKGAVVILDQFKGKPLPQALQMLIDTGNCESEFFGDKTERKIAPAYCGRVKFDDVDSVHEAPSIFKIHETAVANGEIEEDGNNGIFLYKKVENLQAEELWDVYEKPFEDLGAEDPVLDGFDKDYFMGLLNNSEIPKIVSKKNGEACALCIFDQSFDRNPWFNEKYYKDNYPEYYDSQNIFMCPAIVASLDAEGISFGIEMINYLTHIFAKRGTNAMVTFECSQESAKYIPKITKFGINHSGIAQIEDEINTPVTTTEYIAIKKIKQQSIGKEDIIAA
jgi:hypothetical protein